MDGGGNGRWVMVAVAGGVVVVAGGVVVVAGGW